MKKKSRPLLIFVAVICTLTLIIVIGWQGALGDWLRDFSNPVVKEVDIMGINSPYAILIQARGGSVLAESRPDEVIHPASLTKVMTALVALEHIGNMKKEITLPEEIFPDLYAENASQAGFQPGETVTAEDLLYGALLPSGAECCLGLAYMVCDTEEAFVELMNRKAEKLGMKQTHFTNTIGLSDPEHYSSVRDLAVLMKYAVRNRKFREIIESSQHTTAGTNLHPDGITFYSTLFKNLPDPTVTGGQILGGKTGFTDAAGLCLASFAEICGREYILVTCGAESNGNPLHIYDAVTLYDRVGAAAQELSGK